MRKVQDYIVNVVISFVGFGALFGLAMYCLGWNSPSAIAAGITGGLLFAIVILVFSVITQQILKKDAPDDCLYAEPANHIADIEATGGMLFICESKMVFQPHKINLRINPITFFYTEIEKIDYGKFPRSVRITLKNKEQHSFVVNRKKRIKQILEEML